MKRNVKLLAIVALSVLAGLVLKSDRGHGQSTGSQTPIIIKRVVVANQTTSPGTVTLFTPTSNGLYRVTGYGNITSQSSQDEICPVLFWTDESGAQNQNLFPQLSCAFVGTQGNGELVVHALANQPVSLNVGLSSPFTGNYNLFVTVEQL